MKMTEALRWGGCRVSLVDNALRGAMGSKAGFVFALLGVSLATPPPNTDSLLCLTSHTLHTWGGVLLHLTRPTSGRAHDCVVSQRCPSAP